MCKYRNLAENMILVAIHTTSTKTVIHILMILPVLRSSESPRAGWKRLSLPEWHVRERVPLEREAFSHLTNRLSTMM